MTIGRFFIGIFIAFALMGLYTYNERGRMLECRTQVHSNGATIADSVALCKH